MNMSEHKEEIKTWIAALRSGDYEQASRALQQSNGYCCLGVACMLFIPKDKLHLTETAKMLVGTHPSSIYQPYSPEWLTNINDDFYKRQGAYLSDLNDGGKTFNEIANLLEREYIDEKV